MKSSKGIFYTGLGASITVMALLLSGCPYPPDGGTVPGDSDLDYDLGFEEGFAEDGEYWQGYDDSMDTVDFGPIYYQGSAIPEVDSPANDAGYWDGVWYAYNDGYFVSYDYAFTIGFSEGYDIAFSPDWPALLASDEHIEYADGGFSDGYNDGFSEGRIFGAWDYENGWSYDWMDAMWDYRDGTDLEIGGVGTGAYGPVYLYEYGVDPMDLQKSSRKRSGAHPTPTIRKSTGSKADVPDLSYRSLSASATEELRVQPKNALRGSYPLTLSSSWLDRINAYRAGFGTAKKAAHAKRAGL